MEMNVGYLKWLINDLPDNMPVFVGCQGYTNFDFKRNKPSEDTDTFALIHDGKLFITDDCAVEDVNGHEIGLTLTSDRYSFIVSWHADGYTGTFRYLVVANNIDRAREIWEEFVTKNSDIKYSWDKAKRAVANHHGGYITWKANGDCNKEIGCYELEYDEWNVGSDHLWD